MTWDTTFAYLSFFVLFLMIFLLLTKPKLSTDAITVFALSIGTGQYGYDSDEMRSDLLSKYIILRVFAYVDAATSAVGKVSFFLSQPPMPRCCHVVWRVWYGPKVNVLNTDQLCENMCDIKLYCCHHWQILRRFWYKMFGEINFDSNIFYAYKICIILYLKGTYI